MEKRVVVVVVVREQHTQQTHMNKVEADETEGGLGDRMEERGTRRWWF